MSHTVSFGILASVSVVLALISMQFKKRIFPPNLYVFILRFVHFFVLLFAISYIFIFRGNDLDGLFIFYSVFLVVHWQILGDCVVNIWERQHYNKSVPNIYLYTIFGDYTNDIMIIAGLLVMINYIIVIMRQKILPYNLRIIIIVASFIIAILQLRRQYKLDYTVKHE